MLNTTRSFEGAKTATADTSAATMIHSATHEHQPADSTGAHGSHSHSTTAATTTTAAFSPGGQLLVPGTDTGPAGLITQVDENQAAGGAKFVPRMRRKSFVEKYRVKEKLAAEEQARAKKPAETPAPSTAAPPPAAAQPPPQQPSWLSAILCCLPRRQQTAAAAAASAQQQQKGASTAGAAKPKIVKSSESKKGAEKRPALLKPLAPEDVGKKCLVLDLDETLVHSSFKPVANADFVVPVEIDNQVHNVYVLKRPGVDAFLQKMGPMFEIVVFTASLSKYADPVMDKLDKHKVIKHRLFREACIHHKGNYVKDLSMLGRDLKSVIIIDNSPASYIFHPKNAVPCSSWFNDPTDTELHDLVPFLEDLRVVENVTTVLDHKLDDDDDDDDY